MRAPLPLSCSPVFADSCWITAIPGIASALIWPSPCGQRVWTRCWFGSSRGGHEMKIADQIGVRNRSCASVCFVVLFFVSSAAAQHMPGSMDVHWNEGAADCRKVSLPPLQVHAYNQQTFILRQNLCSTFEAPFLYLLIGSSKAMLIDTGDVADPQKMPLAKTVLDLLPSDGSGKRPLLIAHTHRHLDHRAGDGQFQNLPNVQVVGYELERVKEFYRFTQ